MLVTNSRECCIQRKKKKGRKGNEYLASNFLLLAPLRKTSAETRDTTTTNKKWFSLYKGKDTEHTQD